MPSLFRKKSTKSASQPDASTLQLYQSKAQLYDELVAYLQKGASQLSSCTDASSADQAFHEWHYLATSSSSSANLASFATDEEATSQGAAAASPVSDLATILAHALTAKADFYSVKARHAESAQALELTRVELKASREDLNAARTDLQALRAESDSSRAELDTAKHQVDCLRTSLDAAWELVQHKSHSLAQANYALAQAQRDASELKQRVEFLESLAAPMGMAHAAAGDGALPHRPSRFKIVVRDDAVKDDAQKRGLVPADSTATMVEDGEEEEEQEEQEEARGRKNDDARSLGVQTPTPAKMREKRAVLAPRGNIKQVEELSSVGGADDEFEVAHLVPLL